MAFWSDATQAAGSPKRQYRFKVQIGTGTNKKVQSFVVKKTDKPNFAISEAEHKFLNHTYYYPGRVTWNPITVTLVDMGGSEDTSKALATIVRDAGYEPANAQNYSTMSKKSAVKNLGQVVIQQLGSDGKSIEQWVLKNAWIQDLKFGDLDYEGDGLTEVTMVLRYDWAELKSGATPQQTIWSTSQPSPAS